MNAGKPAGRQAGATARWRAALLLAAVLPLALAVLHEAQRTLRADFGAAAARHQVLQWVSGASAPPPQAVWDEALAALQAALALTPDNPELHERLGDLYTVAAQRDIAQPALRRQHFAAAARAYEAATRLRPREPQTWAMLAAVRQAGGEPAAPVQAAWTRALQLGPHESHIEPILMQVVLADWEGASTPMQDWAKALFDNGNGAVRHDINTMAARYGLRFDP